MIIYKPKLSYRVYLSFEAAILFFVLCFFGRGRGRREVD
jgi:hypothetical protein